MPPRFYCPSIPDASSAFVLPPDVAHHAVRVLRLRYGESLAVFNGDGAECEGILVDLGGQAGLEIRSRVLVDREPPLQVTLVQGLAVADKMDWIIQKAVEIGASAVQPVEAERSVLRLSGDRAAKKLAHWQQVAVSAAEQCGRNRLCQVRESLKFSVWLQQPVEGARWVLVPEGGARISALPRPIGPVALMVGPEGGWGDSEWAQAKAAGCCPVAIGPRILRTETAGLAALAAMMALWGDY